MFGAAPPFDCRHRSLRMTRMIANANLNMDYAQNDTYRLFWVLNTKKPCTTIRYKVNLFIKRYYNE